MLCGEGHDVFCAPYQLFVSKFLLKSFSLLHFNLLLSSVEQRDKLAILFAKSDENNKSAR
jgi:hypothetical protein